MRVRPAFVGLLVGLTGVALIAVWFWSSFDRVAYERDLGPAPEARLNPLLAAELVLRELGLETQRARRLSRPPPRLGTVLLLASRQTRPAPPIAGIRQWMESGGHLVMVASASGRDWGEDLLLAELGIRAIATGIAGEVGTDPLEVRLEGSGEVLRVQFDRRYHLLGESHAPQVLAAAPSGIHALTREVGNGRLTVLSDGAFALNQSIGELDHAAFLWALLNLHRTGEVWLVGGFEARSVWALLSEKAWPILVTLVALITAWLWSVSQRFGPLLPEPPSERRRLLEHIEASGRLLWRTGSSGALLDAARESLLRSLEFRHPGWAASTDLYRRLGIVSGLPPDAVRSALEDRDPGEHHFTQILHRLELMRRKL